MPTILQLTQIHSARKPCDYAASELSDALSKAVQAEMSPHPTIGVEGPSYPSLDVYVSEVYPSSNKFVYRVSGKSFIRSYSIADGCKITLKADAKPARQQWLEASSPRKSLAVSLGGEQTRVRSK